MSQVPDDLRYTKEHEWARVQDGKVRVGITDHAQRELGDVVFVELPEVGRELSANDAFGVVESVKAVSDLYAPVSGKVSAVNEALNDAPETVNNDPYGEGWMVEIELSDPSQVDGLLSAEDYQKQIG